MGLYLVHSSPLCLARAATRKHRPTQSVPACHLSRALGPKPEPDTGIGAQTQHQTKLEIKMSGQYPAGRRISGMPAPGLPVPVQTARQGPMPGSARSHTAAQQGHEQQPGAPVGRTCRRVPQQTSHRAPRGRQTYQPGLKTRTPHRIPDRWGAVHVETKQAGMIKSESVVRKNITMHA